MSRLPHLIYPTHPCNGTIRVVCPGVEEGDCRVYDEGTWPDEFTCRCTLTVDGGGCRNCRDGLHDLCEQLEGYVEEVGPECRCEPMDRCGVEVWLEDVSPADLIDWRTDWPDEHPWRADVEWDGGLVLTPWEDAPCEQTPE